MKWKKTEHERFLEKVDQSGACWIWMAGSHEDGYGNFYYNGRVGRAHRYSLEYYKGVVFGPGDQACHSCDVPACVNPMHLFVGRAKANSADMMAKQRHVNPNALKTHCKRNHEFTPENTRINSRGQRVCRECARILERRYREKKSLTTGG